MKRLTEQRLDEIEKANTWNFDWGNVAGGGSRDREKGELIGEIRALWRELTEKDATIRDLQNDLRDVRALIKGSWYETAVRRINSALGEGNKNE